jgi:predicted secreted protein
LSVAQDEQNADKRGDRKCTIPARSRHSQCYLPTTLPANWKSISATDSGASFSAKGAASLQPGASPQEFNRVGTSAESASQS